MDSHYYKVMKLREEIVDTKSRWYFAYSAVLDREAFEAWKEEHSYSFFQLPEGELAEAKGWDIIFDFPSRWWGGRVAGLVESKSSQIFGRLFEISSKDWPVVQHKEGVITGMSVEKKILVNVNGKEVEATAFTTTPSRASTQGEISNKFVEAWTRGLKQADLPKDYIERVRTLALASS